MIKIFGLGKNFILVPIVVSLFLFYVLNTPKYSGVHIITGEKYNPITIRRDNYGVASIEGKTLKDALYGQGFVQAQDRLWALHTRRLLVSGRLSELAGDKTLHIDKFFRNIAIARYCEYALEYIKPETRELFQAFADGVNHFVETSKVLPIEFWLTWSKFDTYTLLDTSTTAKFIAFFLTGDYQFEFITEELERVLGTEKAAELLPFKGKDYPWNETVVMNDDELKQTNIYEKFDEFKTLTKPKGFEFPEERRPPSPSQAIPEPKEDVGQPKPETVKKSEKKETKDPLLAAESQMGSNSWVIHGNLTDTGKPILANDPHLANGIPTVWYPVSMFFGDGEYVSGVGLVGFPGVHIGKTQHASWGITTLCTDTADLYHLTTKGNAYFYEGKWYPMKEFKETIKVRGKEDVEIILYETHHGVVMDNYFADLMPSKSFKPREGKRYALAWPGYQKKDTAYEAFLKILKARKGQDFHDAWKDALEPAFSMVFATTEGDIGFIGIGNIPIRNKPRGGRLPLDGSKKENDWLGFVPWEHQPKIINPKKGYIVSANNKMASDNIKWGSSSNMFTTSRAARIDEMIRDLIKKGKKISVEDCKTIQLDIMDILPRDRLKPMIDRTHNALSKGYKLEVETSKLTGLLNTLTEWDYNTGRDSIGSAIFNVWETLFAKKLIRKVGLNEQDITSIQNNFKFSYFIWNKIQTWKTKIPAEDNFWCHNNQTKGIDEPCLYNLAKSLEETYLYLERKMGKDQSEWKWGKIHNMEYPHGTFSTTPLKPFFHRTFPADGNLRTVNVAGLKLGADDYNGVWSPNLKMVTSLRKGDTSYIVVDTGVSGNPFSEHYDDQMKLVESGKYLEIFEGQKKDWKDTLYLKFRA